MKTRVIQDEPQPAGRKTPVDLASAQMQRAMNIAGRMGAWSAAHWKTAVFGWLACVLVFFYAGNMLVGFKQIDINDAGVGQSHKADQILKKAFPERAPQNELVLIQSASRTADDPAFRSAVDDVVGSVKALDKMFTDQLKLAGERSIPITIGVLLLVLGSLVAVGIPVLLALSGVLGTIGLVAVTSHAVPADQNVNAVILLIGLAVGVDYSLFYIKRWREERAAGKESSAALAAAAATSGRSVLISGFTVLIAMAGLFFAGDKTYLSFGIATMIVVGVAMLGSLTVLPALLSKLGPRVDKGRIPFVHRFRNDAGGSRLWKGILTPVLKHPVAAVALAGGLLVVLALPAVHLHTAQSGLEALPKNAPTVETIQRIQKDFSNGNVAPAIVAVEANTGSPATRQGIVALKKQALASGQAKKPIDVEISASRRVARVTIPLVGNGVDAK